MSIHHLNCGTIDVFAGGGMLGTGTGRPFASGSGVTHCILVETDDGLLLVDTGFGTRDVTAPPLFVRLMMAVSGHPRDLAETASRQIEELGYRREDVRHIAVTHFHYDHAGGLPDFPHAQVHIFETEYQAVTSPQDVYERYPYRAEHWAHGPNWVVHPLAGDTWFGFDATAPVDLGGVTFRFVPLPGHTRGHSGVALRLPDGWLLHCGDAYVYHGDVDPHHPHQPPYHRLVRPFFDLNKAFRAIGCQSARLRALVRDHGDQVALTNAHDPVEMEKLL